MIAYSEDVCERENIWNFMAKKSKLISKYQNVIMKLKHFNVAGIKHKTQKKNLKSLKLTQD